MTDGERPNILIVMADQLVPAALPFHGNDVVQAPHLTALAEDGVVFDNAYTASPLCAPARASLMTGLLPSNTHAYDNAAEFSSEIPTCAHYLRAAGYRTVLAGKMHFCGADQLHGFEERLTTDIYPADYGWTPDWSRPDHRPHWYHDMSSVTEAGPCIRSNQLDFDDEVGFAAERALFEHARSGDERPFCFAVSFTHPHDPYAIPHEWWDLYADVDVPLPEHGHDPAVAQPHDLRLRQMCAMDDVDITDDQVRAARRAYYGAISYVDDKIGRLVEVLRQTGQLDNTVVIVTSDHGDMQGERGLWYKMSFYEGSVRVPLVVSAPSRFAPRRVSTPVSTMDLLPTLVGLGCDPDATPVVGDLDGSSLLPLLRRRGRRPRPARRRVPGRGRDRADRDAPPRRHQARALSRSSPTSSTTSRPTRSNGSTSSTIRRTPTCWPSCEPSSQSRWDLARLDEEVRLSQQRRLLVAGALGEGPEGAWDYAPPYDAARRYIRNHMDLGELETRARFPPVAVASDVAGNPEP